MGKGFGCCTVFGVGARISALESSPLALLEESPLRGGQFDSLSSTVLISPIGPGVGYCSIWVSLAPIGYVERGISPAFLVKALSDDFDSLRSPSAV